MGINDILAKRNKFQDVAEVRSNFDFKFYEIEDENTIDLLIEKENTAKKNMIQIQRNTLELGKVLRDAQEILANNKNGAFKGWFENLGLKKDFVYREIDRYEMYMKYHNEKIKELPVRVVKYISKSEISEAEAIEIIEAEEPSKKIKEIEKATKIELTTKEKTTELEYKILQARKKILQWEDEIKELKK